MMSLAAQAIDGTPARAPVRDADTREWWKITADLSGDDMEGRDTGSPGSARAAAYVAARFKAAGLKPAGDAGAYTQTLRLHEVRVESQGTDFTVVRNAGGEARLRFLHEISVRPTETLPSTLDAPLSFRGYCSTSDMGADLHGRIAVCFGGRRHGLPSASERLPAAPPPGAAGAVGGAAPGGSL